MRNWGIVITGFYALVVTGLLVPAVIPLAVGSWPGLTGYFELFGDSFAWIFVAILIGGQALLLFLAVDGLHRRLEPRQHVLVSISLAGLLFSILTYFVVASLSIVIFKENGRLDWIEFLLWHPFLSWFVLWAVWAGFFYLYLRNSSQLVNRLATWLLRGSVLELLIAIPCHLIIRQRNECTSPVVTSFGVVTGIAIMLLSFGPGVLLLYKKRMDQYKK